RRHGTEAQALSNLAFVFSQYGDLQRAEEAYLRALSLDNTMRPAAQAVVQVAQRRRAEEQLLARRAIARQEPPEDTAERPRTP
ncbi:MAG: tetratricopeptide repeat protein, partial [Thermoguttaceae bacterium]|nr:tetratricopeptide repeat protein [Thermoguttaceae bacterium]